MSNIAATAVLAFSSVLGIGVAPLVSAAGNDCTWTGGGGDTNFSTTGNWSGCAGGAPTDGDNLVFDTTGQSSDLTVSNDISSLSVANITIQGTGDGAVELDGDDLTLTGDVTVTSSNYLTFQLDVILSGNPTLTIGTDGWVSFGHSVSGTGNLTQSGGKVYLNTANSFTGSVTANSGSLNVFDASAFGNSANQVTVNDGADLSIGDASDDGFTVSNPITLSGDSSSEDIPKLTVGYLGHGGGGETYGSVTVDTQTYTLSGDITLGSDVTFGALAKTTTLTGALSGAHKITLDSAYGGQLVVNASSNSTQTSNGTYKAGPQIKTLSDNQPTNDVDILDNGIVTLDGTRGTVNVREGGTLKGTGTVNGVLQVYSGGTLAPGHSPGCMSSGNLIENGTYQAEIGGTTACTGYDQMKVTGTVNLTGGTLDVSLYNGFLPGAGQSYTIIDNDGTDAVTGTFTDLAEGATFTVGDTVFKISYVGGDGNDVVLSVQSTPATPDTGFGMFTSNPLLTLGVTALAGGLIVAGARRAQRVSVKSSRRRR